MRRGALNSAAGYTAASSGACCKFCGSACVGWASDRLVSPCGGCLRVFTRQTAPSGRRRRRRRRVGESPTHARLLPAGHASADAPRPAPATWLPRSCRAQGADARGTLGEAPGLNRWTGACVASRQLGARQQQVTGRAQTHQTGCLPAARCLAEFARLLGCRMRPNAPFWAAPGLAASTEVLASVGSPQSLCANQGSCLCRVWTEIKMRWGQRRRAHERPRLPHHAALRPFRRRARPGQSHRK